MRRLPRFAALPGVAVVLAAGVLLAPSPAAAEWPVTIFSRDSITIAIADRLPGDDADPVLAGVGVYPGSRDAEAFLTQIGTGAPTGGVSGASGRPFGLIEALGGDVKVEAVGPRAALAAYGGRFAPAGRDAVRGRPVLRFVDGDASDADLIIHVPPSGRTPLLLAMTGDGFRGLMAGGQSRRPAVVTPYDISATIVRHFERPIPKTFVGRVLQRDPAANPLALAREIAGRLQRDASFMQSLTAWTVIIGLGFGWLVAWIVAGAGKRDLARRFTSGASTVTIGFLIGLFIPSARGDVRAIPMLVLFAAAAAMRWRDPEAAAMRFFVVASGATAILAVAAAAAPGSVVAHALWGNPLVSWRLFGLQNFAAAFIAGGIIVAATRLGLRAAPLGIVGAALLVVVGSPRIGANFVAVLTFAFGAAVAVLAVGANKPKSAHVPVAAAVALGAFALALFADAGNATSHGGAAAQQIGRGGLSALWDITIDRLRLNVRAINAFPGGWLWVVAFLGLYAAMMRDAWTKAEWPPARRAAVAAGALAGLAALGLEDSGFKTTAVLGFPALLLWTFAEAGRPVFRGKTAGQGHRA